MRLARSLSARVVATLALVAALVGVPASSAVAQSAYYVAPNGNDSAAGTQAAPWRSFARAQSAAQAGDTVYFRGGTYAYTNAAWNCSSQTDRVSAILLNKSGSPGNPITYSAYPGETPVFDFSGMTNDCRIKGIEVTADRIHLKGLEITGVPQNNNLNAENWGVWISGSHNTFEQLNIHHIMGTGLFINGGGGNLVLNSDSHHNYDPHTRQGPGESADGFGSHYTPAGNPANVFRGNRAWENADDGFDLISTYSPVTIENSWSWRNGFEPGTNNVAGNGAGFKIGGYGRDWVSNAPKHTVTNNVAFNNNNQGFYANYHPIASDFFNNTAYSNRPNFSMRGVTQSGDTSVGRGTLRNNIAYSGVATAYMNGTNSAYNTWDLAVQVSASDFQSVSTSGWDAPRQADGSLPVLPHLRLAEGSDLIDAGTDVGLPYEGAAPDLGAFEFGGGGGGTPPGGGGQIVARHSGKCLDVHGVSTANGAVIQQYDCWSGANQQFELRNAGGGYVEIVAQHSGKCLDVAAASTANGAAIQQYDCWGGQNQQFELRNAGGGYVQIVARHSGKCLDVTGVSTANGAVIQQYDCWSGQNQQWTI